MMASYEMVIMEYIDNDFNCSLYLTHMIQCLMFHKSYGGKGLGFAV